MQSWWNLLRSLPHLVGNGKAHANPIRRTKRRVSGMIWIAKNHFFRVSREKEVFLWDLCVHSSISYLGGMWVHCIDDDLLGSRQNPDRIRTKIQVCLYLYGRPCNTALFCWYTISWYQVIFISQDLYFIKICIFSVAANWFKIWYLHQPKLHHISLVCTKVSWAVWDTWTHRSDSRGTCSGTVNEILFWGLEVKIFSMGKKGLWRKKRTKKGPVIELFRTLSRYFRNNAKRS